MRYQPFKRIESGLIQDSASLLTTEVISRRMGGIRQSGTTPELRIRRICTDLGLRYRTKNRNLPGSPDLANRTRRWAIFAHGCYWHRHHGCPNATTPKNNREFWVAKFARNEARDRRAQDALVAAGFTVLVVWECETENAHRLYDILRRLAGAIE